MSQPLRMCHREAARRDFSGQPERHDAPRVSMFLSPLDSRIFIHEYAHMEFIAPQPPAAGWGINRVQLSIKDEESPSMEGIVQRRW